MNTTLVNLRTTVNSATHEGHRDLLLQAALLAQGFAIDTEQTGRKASQKPRWRATSHDIDAQDIKHHLQDGIPARLGLPVSERGSATASAATSEAPLITEHRGPVTSALTTAQV